MTTTQIYKGDTAENLLTIYFENSTEFEIYKIVLQCGEINKEFIEPTSPIRVSFTSEETKKLTFNNTVYMAAVDKYGRIRTFDGYATFGAKRQVVHVRQDQNELSVVDAKLYSTDDNKQQFELTDKKLWAKLVMSFTPSKTSQLVNDSGFITKDDINLDDYATKEYVGNAVNNIESDISGLEGDIEAIQSQIGDISNALDAINGEVIE